MVLRKKYNLLVLLMVIFGGAASLQAQPNMRRTPSSHTACCCSRNHGAHGQSQAQIEADLKRAVEQAISPVEKTFALADLLNFYFMENETAAESLLKDTEQAESQDDSVRLWALTQLLKWYHDRGHVTEAYEYVIEVANRQNR